MSATEAWLEETHCPCELVLQLSPVCLCVEAAAPLSMHSPIEECPRSLVICMWRYIYYIIRVFFNKCWDISYK